MAERESRSWVVREEPPEKQAFSWQELPGQFPARAGEFASSASGALFALSLRLARERRLESQLNSTEEPL